MDNGIAIADLDNDGMAEIAFKEQEALKLFLSAYLQ